MMDLAGVCQEECWAAARKIRRPRKDDEVMMFDSQFDRLEWRVDNVWEIEIMSFGIR